MFGLLSYNYSYNLGDEIQSIAGQQFLPQVDYLVDRDTSSLSFPAGKPSLPSNSINSPIHLIANGWFDGQYCRFPFPEEIDPLFISFHINETDHSKDSMYDVLSGLKIPFKSLASHLDYLKKYEPIGCRDLATVTKLRDYGIQAEWSGCLTLTLRNPFQTRNDEILIVDSHIMCPKLVKQIIPESILQRSIKISQAISQIKPHEEKMQLAQQFLNRLAQAKLVITSRLHTAMPCLAFGTPVIFLTEEPSDIRFTGLINFVKSYTTGDQLDVDLETYQNPPSSELNTLIANLRSRVTQWVQQNQAPKAIQLLGTSIVSVCMNRSEQIEKSLPTWLAANPNEIILVDWGSEPPIKDLVDRVSANYTNAGIIRLIRVDDVKHWVLTTSYNLGFRLSRYQYILKLDADSLLEPDFLDYHSLVRPGIFFAGDWRKARNVNERHLNGVIYVRREDFFKAGAYNEYITTYGYDDCDLYQRLEVTNKRLLVNFDRIRHLPHSNVIRVSNANPDGNQSVQSLRLDIEIERNRLISEKKLWNQHSKFAIFNVDNQAWTGDSVSALTSSLHLHPRSYFKVNYVSSPELSPSISHECLQKAIRNRNFYVSSLPPPPKKLYIHTVNGLGNRLRALASAATLAQATKRQLIIIWIPDNHCQAKLTDLFKVNFLFKDVTIIDTEADVLISDLCYDKLINYEAGTPTLDTYNYIKSKDKVIDTQTHKDIYILSACVLKNGITNWYLESNWLRNLEPIDEIGQTVYDFTREAKMSGLIGLHIRMGQDPNQHGYEDYSNYSSEAKASLIKWRHQSHWSVFLSEIKKVLEKNPGQQFFLCCDDPKSYDIICEDPVCHQHIIYIKRNCYDRSQAQIKTALIDLILLSRTKVIWGSNWSSFTEIAHRMGGQQLRLAGVDF
jgi:hypothetical protein